MREILPGIELGYERVSHLDHFPNPPKYIYDNSYIHLKAKKRLDRIMDRSRKTTIDNQNRVDRSKDDCLMR